jgi:hypothetical protein
MYKTGTKTNGIFFAQDINIDIILVKTQTILPIYIYMRTCAYSDLER